MVAQPHAVIETFIGANPNTPLDAGAVDQGILHLPHPSDREVVTIGKTSGIVTLWDTQSGARITESQLFGRSGVGTCTVRRVVLKCRRSFATIYCNRAFQI